MKPEGGFGPENEFHVVLEPQETNIWAGGEISCTVTGNSNTRLAFLFSDPDKGRNPAVPPVNPTVLNDNLWHHIGIVWDGSSGTIKMFIDGQLLDMQDDYEADPYEFSHMFLGKMANDTRRLIGLLDEVRMYSNALSDEEVLAVFDGSISAIDKQTGSFANDFVLMQNYPNPFNPQTTISFSIANPATVKINIYDMSGRFVSTFNHKKYQAGIHKMRFDGSALASGVYFLRARMQVRSKKEVHTMKMILMK